MKTFRKPQSDEGQPLSDERDTSDTRDILPVSEDGQELPLDNHGNEASLAEWDNLILQAAKESDEGTLLPPAEMPQVDPVALDMSDLPAPNDGEADVLKAGVEAPEKNHNLGPQPSALLQPREVSMPNNDTWMSIIEAHPELSYHQAEIILLIASYVPGEVQALERAQYLLDRMKCLDKA